MGPRHKQENSSTPGAYSSSVPLQEGRQGMWPQALAGGGRVGGGVLSVSVKKEARPSAESEDGGEDAGD